MHKFHQIRQLKRLALKLCEIYAYRCTYTNHQLYSHVAFNIKQAELVIKKYIKLNDKQLLKTMFSNNLITKKRIAKANRYLVLLQHDTFTNIPKIVKHYKYIFFDIMGMDDNVLCDSQNIHTALTHFFNSSNALSKNTVLHIIPVILHDHKFYRIIYTLPRFLKYWNVQSYKKINVSNLSQLITVDSFMLSEAYSAKTTNWVQLAKTSFNELKHNLYLGMRGGVSPYSHQVMQSFCSNLVHTKQVPVIGLNHVADNKELVQVLVRLMYLQNIYDVIYSNENSTKKYRHLQNTNMYVYYDLMHKTKHFIYRHAASSKTVLKIFKRSRDYNKCHILSIGRLHYYNENLKHSVGPLEIITYIPLSLFHPINDMYRTYQAL